MKCPEGPHGLSTTLSVLKQKSNILIEFFLYTLVEQDYSSNFTNERLKRNRFVHGLKASPQQCKELK